MFTLKSIGFAVCAISDETFIAVFLADGWQIVDWLSQGRYAGTLALNVLAPGDVV